MHKPLSGKRIVVTRPREQAAVLCQKLAAAGATPIRFPTIRIAPMADTGPLDAAIARLDGYDWVIFTSVNGVAYFWERLAAAAHGAVPAGTRVAASGPATARALNEKGCRPDFVPEEFVAERIAEGLGNVSGKWLLLPRAQSARKALADLLVAAGATVDEIPTYRTLAESPNAKAIAALEAGVDVLTFTSSSTARYFAAILGERAAPIARGALIACIGPITAQTVRDLGFEVGLVAREYTTDGLIEALARQVQTSR